MKTLELELTPEQKVTLTYSEIGQEWDIFSGNADLLCKMAESAGWNFQESRQRLADWAAENKDLFVKEEKEQTTDELWGENHPDHEDEESRINFALNTTREFSEGVSDLNMLLVQDYRKIVHVNGEGAALFFYIKDSEGKLIPWTGTRYYSFGFESFEKLPTLIKRHIDVEKLQDYANAQAMGDFKKYPYGLHFEEQELVRF